MKEAQLYAFWPHINYIIVLMEANERGDHDKCKDQLKVFFFFWLRDENFETKNAFRTSCNL